MNERVLLQECANYDKYSSKEILREITPDVGGTDFFSPSTNDFIAAT